MSFVPEDRLGMGLVGSMGMTGNMMLRSWRKGRGLFLDRKDIKKGLKTILSGIELIKSGISVCILPEGTRNRNESDLELLEFHEGSFRLATKTDCLIVPIAMNNTVSIFEKQFPKIRKNHVVLEYCKPFRPSELSKEDQKHIGEYTRTLILETLKKNEPLV